jgi:hypothetical protein
MLIEVKFDGSLVNYKDEIISAIDLINRNQKYCTLKFINRAFMIQERRITKRYCKELQETYCKKRQKRCNMHDKEIYLTSKNIYNDDFVTVEKNISVITTQEWADWIKGSLSCFIAYQICFVIVCFATNVTDETIVDGEILNHNVLGCLMDYCSYPKDLQFGIVAGRISGQACARLISLAPDTSVFDSIQLALQSIREKVLGVETPVDLKQVFVVMRITQGDENAEAYQNAIIPVLNRLGLHVKRSDMYPRGDELLNTILKAIDQSGFVFVKIDDANANIYFEYGYARAKNKFIIPICHNLTYRNSPNDSPFPGIPSDLKGVFLLNYSKGNYEELAGMIEQHLREHYTYIF